MIDPPSPAPTEPSSLSPITRRDFLSLAWKSLLALSGALGLAGLWRYFSYQPTPPPVTHFDLGPVEELSRTDAVVIEDAQAVLLPTADGFKALSLVCPHLGCEADVKKDGFICPCHGSRFDLNGNVTHGPATRSLQLLWLSISDDGHLILDTEE
jgi:cytochrome b6-f complex iron-sulfur subunit